MDEQAVVGLLSAFADADRIRMLAAISESPRTTPDLAADLGLPIADVGKHLAILGRSGLISTGAGGQLGLSADRLKQVQDWCAAGVKADSSEAIPAAIRPFFRDGRIVSMPARRSKQLEILRLLIEDFEIGREYPEVEVNAILARRWDDFATLRRDFIDEGMMVRDRGIYRRVDPVE